MTNSNESCLITIFKVYYFLDDETTPYVSVINKSVDNVTLGDFKRNFTKKGYKYFCKELDKEIGWYVSSNSSIIVYLYSEVKIELTEDNCRLRKSANGLLELYLLSLPGYGTLPRAGTLPRREKDPYSMDYKNEMVSVLF